MPLPIITADQRLAEVRGIKGAIFGPYGIGKTSLLHTMNPKTTLFVDLEAGDLAVRSWPGDTLRPRTWDQCRNLAVYIAGPDPRKRSDEPYCQAHYDAMLREYGGAEALAKYETIFIDSITVSGRWCLHWCQGQPQAFSEKSGKPDNRGAYGLHGQEMIKWITHLQHTPDKNVWFVGILEQKTNEAGPPTWEPQIDGSMVGRQLPGIVDQVVTMTMLSDANGTMHRSFVCDVNPWGFPAKTRTPLNMVEPPHLGDLMTKINGLKPRSLDQYSYAMPAHDPNQTAGTAGFTL